VTPSQRLQSAYKLRQRLRGNAGPFTLGLKIKRLPAGFVVPAQPIKASKPPSGPDWVHEIKHDAYRLIVRQDGPTVRLYTRNAYDWTARLSVIAAAAARMKAKSFTIDGEAGSWHQPSWG
jgi:bifunctional non-homologous end joining protein LigD